MDRISEFLKLNEEQARILPSAGKVAVRAGAGSGKTRAIIAKYLRILEAGEADIPQIVTVTFTEAAAAELKSRISSEITRYLSTYGPRGNITEGWRRKFFSAPIATIHGFCTKILKENIFDSKLPFSFSVIEDSEQPVFYERNIGKFLLKRVEEGDPRLGRLLEMESYDYAEIVKIIGMILKEAAKLHLVPPFLRYGGGTRHEELSADELESINGELLRLIGEHVSTLSAGSKKKKLILSDLNGKIDMTLGIDRNIRHLQAVYEQIKEERKTPEVELSRQTLLRQVFSVVESYDSEISSLYLDLAGEAYDFLVETKISEEKIEYEDMIRFTIDLFTESPEILGYYRSFLKFIIVDEFQDTDSLQLALVGLLTEGDPAGNLIVVGDVNQSVYGFRGAQPEIFGNILENENFGKISFATNYRSHRSLIEFFNIFFAGTFSKKYYEMMEASCSDPDPDISVEIIACEGENAKESGEAEARAVASRIKELQRKSRGEIALLFRRASNVVIYENALTEEGIRFQSLIGRDFYDLPEVRDVMSMLRYFLDPFDVIAEASVLRSPYFGASDDELFSYFRGENESRNAARVREYLRFLGEKRKKYINGDTFRTVDFIVNGLGYSSAVRALPGGEIKHLNLKKFLLMAEDLVSRKGYGLYQAVEHFDSLRGSQEERAFEEVSDGGIVKLMTVHKAKGLEFDTVFLCHTNYQRVVVSERVMADIEGGGFIVRYPAFSSDSWQHLKSRVETKEAEEEKRALYVAMTRARKGLFICLSGRARKKQIRVQRDSFAELADSKLSLSSRCLEMPQGFTDKTWGISFPGLYGDEASEEPDPILGTPSLETEIPLDLKYMDSLYGKEEKPREAEISPLPDLFSPTDRLKDPERAGSIMHRFLEIWDFREETVEKEIEFVLGEFLVSNPNMKELLLELSSSFLESELLPLIRAAGEVRRELKFVFHPGEGVPKRGRIDLLTEEEGGMRLFDYKYRKSMSEDAREAYKEQMDGYCEAISSRFEKPLLSRHIVLIPQVELVSI